MLPCRLEPGALDIGLRRLDRIFRFRYLRVLRRLARLQVVDRGFGAEKIRLGLRHPGPIIVVLDLDQQIASFDALEVIDRDATHIALDLGAERRDVAANIGVVGDLADRQADPAIPLGRKEDDDNPRGDQERESDKCFGGPVPSSRPGNFGGR